MLVTAENTHAAKRTLRVKRFSRIASAAMVMGTLWVGLGQFPAEAQSTKYTFQTPTEQYLSLRRAHPPTPGLTPAVIAEDPRKWLGQTLELEGRLAGIVRTADNGALLMLTTDRSGSLTLSMSQVPAWLQSGTRLRVMAIAADNVPDEEGGVSVSIGVANLQVVCVASSTDILAVETRYAKEMQERSRRNQSALNAATAQLAKTPSRQSRPSLGSRSSSTRTPGKPVNGLSATALAVFQPYRDFIWRHNRRLTAGEADAITSSLLLFSERYDVDPRLVVALIIAESDFNPRSTSHKGAMGLGQIMPDEAKRIGLTNPYDPVQNVAGAIYLLRGRLDRYSGGAGQKDLQEKHIMLALASYNAGMGAVKKYKGIPPYRETQNYVRKVTRLYKKLCAGDQG